jgi:hypothetical protein
MHDPVPQTGRWLRSVVQGYFNYYVVPGNLASFGVFRDRVLALWWRTMFRFRQRSDNWGASGVFVMWLTITSAWSRMCPREEQARRNRYPMADLSLPIASIAQLALRLVQAGNVYGHTNICQDNWF